MAKGNMLQGMATGKLGDVVFARANGEQISRVRNRHPRNPKTNKQMYQRAVMATVMQAYAAGQKIFNHAFQGRSVGAENQRAFLSKNAKLLRSAVASELAQIAAGTLDPDDARAACVVPGAVSPVPGTFLISEGTYDQRFFSTDGEFTVPDAIQVPVPEGSPRIETVSEYATRNGLVPGDLYTVVCFQPTGTVIAEGVDDAGVPSTIAGTKQQGCTFAYIRLQVKDNVLTSTDPAVSGGGSSIRPTTFFDITDEFNGAVLRKDSGEFAFNRTLSTNGSVGIIRSRLDADLRSTTTMAFTDYAGSLITDDDPIAGITSPYILATWKRGTEALGDSDLILEGGDE